MSEKEPFYCKACGSIDQEISGKLAELQETVQGLGVEVARKGAMITRLRKAQANERPPEYEDAMKVARYWKEILSPNARELNGPRVQNTIARLQHGYSTDDLMKSLWGYSCRPNVKEFGVRVRFNEGGKRKVELADLMRDAKAVDRGIEIADEEMRFDQGIINDGGSRFVAGRCDCGHARGSHALYRMHGHDACLEEGCDCREFDDMQWQVDEWLERQRMQNQLRERKRPTVPKPPQATHEQPNHQRSML